MGAKEIYIIWCDANIGHQELCLVILDNPNNLIYWAVKTLY